MAKTFADDGPSTETNQFTTIRLDLGTQLRRELQADRIRWGAKGVYLIINSILSKSLENFTETGLPQYENLDSRYRNNSVTVKILKITANRLEHLGEPKSLSPTKVALICLLHHYNLPNNIDFLRLDSFTAVRRNLVR